MLYGTLKPLVAVLLRLLFRVEALHPERVPAAGPLLVVSNHASLLDPPLVGGVCPRRLAFLAKAELFRIPLFGRLIHALGARPVRRDGADPAALRTALRALEGEGALLVFPEGTRAEHEDRLRPAKPGVGMLAVMSGAAVVPVYVSGSGRAWPRGRRLPRPTKVRVVFGEPRFFAAPPGADRKRLYEAASRDMMAAIANLKDSLAAGETRSAPRLHAQIQ
jgi:1-acyl-sn-glycerol-3-phosphate acyltransferase